MQAKNKAVLPQNQDSDDKELQDIFRRHDQAMIGHGQAMPTHALPLPLKKAIEILCETYETLDLRLDTTLTSAPDDFVAALSEVDGHETELRALVGLLIGDLRAHAGAKDAETVLLHLSFHDEGDLTQQILSIIETSEAGQ